MYTYKVIFLNKDNRPLNHVIVHADHYNEAFREAEKEYKNRKWKFKYAGLAGERL